MEFRIETIVKIKFGIEMIIDVNKENQDVMDRNGLRH